MMWNQSIKVKLACRQPHAVLHSSLYPYSRFHLSSVHPSFISSSLLLLSKVLPPLPPFTSEMFFKMIEEFARDMASCRKAIRMKEEKEEKAAAKAAEKEKRGAGGRGAQPRMRNL